MLYKTNHHINKKWKQYDNHECTEISDAVCIQQLLLGFSQLLQKILQLYCKYQDLLY